MSLKVNGKEKFSLAVAVNIGNKNTFSKAFFLTYPWSRILTENEEHFLEYISTLI